METPICVVDAKTLVDHIQDLKYWIYSGQLRVVVPSCTIDQVDQLYQKSIEPKPTTQEAPRSRSSGKPPKKEYPAFDINPRVAGEYLGRLKNRKEQGTDSEQRLFFQEKENLEAVRFQDSNEQYTPWKELDVEEEQPKAIEGPPTSWAEALRRKQNLANGTSEKSVSKAPTKPKLVARAAGSETSPWKVKKDAPKISAKDVPGVMRPLMSCALWCLHESIERNDANQLFLLSDQIETRAVAQKLNITVRSCTEVAITIASKDSKTSLDNFGDLEREFGVQLKSVLSNTRDAEEVNVEEVVIENANEEMLKNGDVMEKSMSSEGTASTDASSIVHEGDLEKKVSEPRIKTPSVNGDRDDGKIKEQGFMAETATSSIAENLQKKPAKSVESVKCPADGIMHQDSENHLVRLSESVNGLSLDGVKSQSDLANKPALGHSAVLSPLGTSLLQLHDVEPLSLIHQVQTISGTSKPPENTTAYSTSTSNSVQEPEDSDEEVVVFVPQPKRLSAQQKPAQQSSRPSTPKEQSQQKSSLKAPPKGKVKKPSPKPSTVDQAHSQPFCSPTVIDPDAFGRNYRVNLNTSPRSAHNHNGHCSHRIRGNMQSAQTGQIPRNSPRQLARTSPPRNVPQDRSQRLTPVPPRPLPKETPNHQRLASRTSPPRLPASKAEDVPSSDVGSRASAAVLFSKSQYSESRTGEPAEFVPQPAFSITQLESDGIKSGNEGPVGDMTKSAPPNAQLKANAPQPRVFEPSEFVRRPPRPVPEFKPRAPRHKAFEPAEFVPKDFSPKTAMPRTQLKTYPPEPESIEPRPSINDVDYVLKSGSSRASARGRGRLWTPS